MRARAGLEPEPGVFEMGSSVAVEGVVVEEVDLEPCLETLMLAEERW